MHLSQTFRRIRCAGRPEFRERRSSHRYEESPPARRRMREAAGLDCLAEYSSVELRENGALMATEV